MEIVACDIGSRCIYSYPCQHNCIITHANGTTSKRTLNGASLVTDAFWKVLDKESKEHFYYMKRWVYQQQKDTSHCLLFINEKMNL